MSIEFYHVKNNSTFESVWTWGASLHPRLSEISIVCDVCGIGRLYPGSYPERDFLIDVEGGAEYPDVLGCGAYPLLIVSQSVIADWESNRVSGYEKFPMSVKSLGANIQRGCAPEYYHLKVLGRCQLDLDSMGVEIIQHCPKCNYTRKNPLVVDKFVINSSSWDGSDLFLSPFFPAIIFCSRKILDLAVEMRRTNFRFQLAKT